MQRVGLFCQQWASHVDASAVPPHCTTVYIGRGPRRYLLRSRRTRVLQHPFVFCVSFFFGEFLGLIADEWFFLLLFLFDLSEIFFLFIFSSFLFS